MDFWQSEEQKQNLSADLHEKVYWVLNILLEGEAVREVEVAGTRNVIESLHETRQEKII